MEELGYKVLGPFEVRAAGKTLALGSAKRRLVLATLLLNANRLVTTGRLIEAVWPGEAPRSAVANLYTYVSGLRACLPGGEERITTRATGYTLTVRPGELDLEVFETLAGEAAAVRQEGRAADALGLLDRGLALWAGPPLADLPAGPALEADLARLSESRLGAAEERLELLVSLGKHVAAVAGARALLDQHPFRERSWQQLLRALHLSGRRAEALQTYVDVRGRFVDEIGVEPGPELRRTHEAILASDSVPAEEAWVRDPSDLLAQLLRGLGVSEMDIPEHSALFRAQLADRRVLMRLGDRSALP